MKPSLATGLVVGLLVPIILGTTVSWGSSADTSCWDEYNKRGTRLYRTVTPKGLPLDDCTPADTCLWGYNLKGSRSRLYVPHGADPATACEDAPAPTTTEPPATTTTAPPVTPDPVGRFETLPVGATLPSDAECASLVRPMSENRPANAAANATRGSGPDATYSRVTGDFVGTTDEILQWTACKWGIDEDWVRAQIVNESAWNQGAIGDFTSDPDACAPGFPIGDYPPQYDGDWNHAGECPESVGLGQVRWLYHGSAFADNNAVASSAYNADYTYAVWRECFEGGFGWLNDVEGRGDYAAGDAKGCLGVWFSGRWYTDAAIGYIDRFDQTLNDRSWERDWFGAAEPGSGSTTPTPVVPAETTVAPPETTVAPPETTVAPPETTVAPPETTVAPTTTVPAPQGEGSDFIETFDGNTGLERFATGMYHRDEFLVAETQWTGDHDLNCGGPDTQRTIHRDRPDESFYMCRNHMMTSIGDTSGYSIGWFSPDANLDGQADVFSSNDIREVSWDVNITDLGTRQWWEVVLVADGTPFLTTIDWVAETAHIEGYHSDTITVGAGPFGNDGNVFSGGKARDPLGWSHIPEEDPEAAASKAIRRPFRIVDNRNGTITFDFLGQSYTYAGEFPSEFSVYFKDHNYTPDKDGTPVGHTYHWDNIVVRG